jgi:hypothetical protein
MENIVDSSGHGEFQLIHHRGDFFDNLKGIVSFGFELHFLMADFQVGCF